MKQVNAHRNYAEIFWTAPKDCTSIKGPIKGYNVTLMAVSPWVNTNLSFPNVQGLPDKPFVRFETLIPYTQYNASVFVKGPNGKTNPALPYSVNFTTLADGECEKVKWRIVSNFVARVINFMILLLTFETVYISFHNYASGNLTRCVI
jgi:hypothetical protein